MTAIRNSSPPFEAAGVVFECFVVDGGYEWLSTCGRFAAWGEVVRVALDPRTDPLGRTEAHLKIYHARADGRVLDADCPSLRDAMVDAVVAQRRQRRPARAA